MSYEHFKIYCRIAISKPIVTRALKISVLVGTLLNLINQGDRLFSMEFEEINMIKFLLTYLVPYSVTTYTATVMKVEFQMGTKAVVAADLECKKCHAEIHVEENELIPECKTCGIKTSWRLK